VHIHNCSLYTCDLTITTLPSLPSPSLFVNNPSRLAQVFVDMKEVAAGTLFEDWDMLPSKTIKVGMRCVLPVLSALHTCMPVLWSCLTRCCPSLGCAESSMAHNCRR
jgi:hypothetical protein